MGREIRKNVARDKRNYQLLKKLGWKVIVVWECELYKDTLITVEKVVDILLQSDKMLDGRSDLPGVLKRDILLKSAAKKVMRRLNKVCKVEK